MTSSPDPPASSSTYTLYTLFCLHGVPWSNSCFACGRRGTDLMTEPPSLCPACNPVGFGPGACCTTTCRCRCHFPLGTGSYTFTNSFPSP